MQQEQNLPRPSVQVLDEFHELHKKALNSELTGDQRMQLMWKSNEYIEAYDLTNYIFDDPATGKMGVKDPAGRVMVPACYDGFSFIGDQFTFVVRHMAVKKDGKWGVVSVDGTNQVLCDFRFDYLQWYPYIGLYIARWDGDKDHYGFVNKEGKVFISNILSQLYEPCNDFMMLESDGKFGALDIYTFHHVLPEYDEIIGDFDTQILFRKGDVQGYIIEETGEFVPKDIFEQDEEKYDDAYVYNAIV